MPCIKSAIARKIVLLAREQLRDIDFARLVLTVIKAFFWNWEANRRETTIALMGFLVLSVRLDTVFEIRV
jgi:hypothetical protein